MGTGPHVALGVDLLRGGLSLFALLNAAGWAALAAAWKFRPEWAERLPLQLGTHERYLKAAPVWARLAASLTGFWALAAALYLTAGHNTAPIIVIALFTAAAACLIRHSEFGDVPAFAKRGLPSPRFIGTRISQVRFLLGGV